MLFVNGNDQIQQRRDKTPYRSGRHNPKESGKPRDIGFDLTHFLVGFRNVAKDNLNLSFKVANSPILLLVLVIVGHSG